MKHSSNNVTMNDTLFDAQEQSRQEKPENQNSSELEGHYKADPISISVFRRETDNGKVFRNYELQRSYPVNPDAEDPEFSYTHGLRPRDLRKAARLLQKAADDIEDVRKVPGGRQ